MWVSKREWNNLKERVWTLEENQTEQIFIRDGSIHHSSFEQHYGRYEYPSKFENLNRKLNAILDYLGIYLVYKPTQIESTNAHYEVVKKESK